MSSTSDSVLIGLLVSDSSYDELHELILYFSPLKYSGHATQYFYCLALTPIGTCSKVHLLIMLTLGAGYGKMPGYEHIFTDFFLSLAQSKYKRYLSGT
jgi:hypothetical protein